MKRLLCLMLSFIMLFSSLSSSPANAAEERTEYLIPVVSDVAGRKYIKGSSNESMLKNGMIMVPIEDVCEIANAEIKSQDDKSILVSRNTVSWCCTYNDNNNQYIIIDIKSNQGNFIQSISEEIRKDDSVFKSILGTEKNFSFNPDYNEQGNNDCSDFDLVKNVSYSERTELPYELIENKLYVSFYHFLKMMGVSTKIVNRDEIQNQINVLNYISDMIGDDNSRMSFEELYDFHKHIIGYDTYISCTLGLPLDSLYQEYYNNDYLFKMGDYYSTFDVAVANIANSITEFDGITKTIASAADLDYKYDDSIIEVITQKGENVTDGDNSTSISDIAQKGALTYSQLYSSQELAIELINNPELMNLGKLEASSLNKGFVEYSKTISNLGTANNVFEIALSGCIGYMKACETANKLEILFDDDKEILKNTVLSSERLNKNIEREKDDTNLLIQDGLYKASRVDNSYNNFLRSSQHIQDYITDPEIMKKTDSAREAFFSAADTLVLTGIDLIAFGGVPVTSLACTVIQQGTTILKGTPYFEEKNNIANIDDYIFIQSIAKDCFKENKTESGSKYYSYTLGVKASLTAYKANKSDKSKRIALERMLSMAVDANRYYYNTNLDDTPDLRETLLNNTDLNKELPDIIEQIMDITTKTEDITDIYYRYIETDLIPIYGLAELTVPEVDYDNTPDYSEINGLFSAFIKEIDSQQYLITVRYDASLEKPHLILEMYSYANDSIKKIDALDQELSDWMVSSNIGLIDDHLCFDWNYAYRLRYSHFGGESIIITITENGFLKEFSLYDTHRDGGYLSLYNKFSDKEYYSTEGGSYPDINDAISLIKNDLTMLSENNYEISFENGSFIFNLNYDRMLAEYNMYNQLAADLTDLRSHLKLNNVEKLSDVTGRYSKECYSVDVDGSIGNEGTISIEYNDDNGKISFVSWSGVIEKELSLTIDDGYSNNNYKIKFYNDKIDFMVDIKEITNQLYGKAIINDISTTLPKVSDNIPTRDISSWDNERMIRAINNMLWRNDDNRFSAYLSDISGQSVILRDKNGEYSSDASLFVSWGTNDDIVLITQNHSDLYGSRYHLYDYDTDDNKYLLINAPSTHTNEQIGVVITEKDDLNVRKAPSADSEKIGTIAKGGTVQIISEENGWYKIAFNGGYGYVAIEFIRINGSNDSTASQAESRIEVYTASPWANGLTYILHMDGDYTSYSYDLYTNDPPSPEPSDLTLYSSGTSDKTTLELCSASTITRIKVVITPYDSANNAGKTIQIEADDSNLIPMPQIVSADKKGVINVHGGIVSGYDKSYVLFNGKSNEKIRESLGDGWHITAVSQCEKDGITWYELYDTDDHDYYGWVDSKFIDFF